jgi:hypothetical protein
VVSSFSKSQTRRLLPSGRRTAAALRAAMTVKTSGTTPKKPPFDRHGVPLFRDREPRNGWLSTESCQEMTTEVALTRQSIDVINSHSGAAHGGI